MSLSAPAVTPKEEQSHIIYAHSHSKKAWHCPTMLDMARFLDRAAEATSQQHLHQAMQPILQMRSGERNHQAQFKRQQVWNLGVSSYSGTPSVEASHKRSCVATSWHTAVTRCVKRVNLTRVITLQVLRSTHVTAEHQEPSC